MIGPMLSSGRPASLPAGATTLDLTASPIRIGVGAIRDLPAALAALGIVRPFLATDPGLEAAGLAGSVVAALEGASLHAGLDLDAAAVCYRETRCDGLVALGGGSVIAAAKELRPMLGGPPLVAIPTTGGPGVEMTAAHPTMVLCDPALACSLPPDLTAATGLDALGHCIEGFLSVGFQPFCDAAAVEGLRHLFRGLEASIQDGGDVSARSAMAVGSLLGGAASNKGLGVAHALARAVEVDAHGRHATLAAVLLPHALRFNREAAESRMADLATRVGLGRAGDGPGHLITLVELLRANAPLPRKLRDVPGASRDRFTEYARIAMLDPAIRSNPRPCTDALLEELLDRAW